MKSKEELHILIEKKLNELVQLLRQADMEKARIKYFRQKINNAFKQTGPENQMEAFKAFDNQDGLSRNELLNSLDVLLSQHQLDSKLSKKYIRRDWTKRIILVLTGMVMITLGYGMIILPAPPYFELFTLFYFNDQDGVTIMDLISLLIILVGVFLIVVNVSKKNHQ